MVIDEIAKDLYRMSAPLPMTSLKSVNSYVVRDKRTEERPHTEEI